MLFGLWSLTSSLSLLPSCHTHTHIHIYPPLSLFVSLLYLFLYPLLFVCLSLSPLTPVKTSCFPCCVEIHNCNSQPYCGHFFPTLYVGTLKKKEKTCSRIVKVNTAAAAVLRFNTQLGVPTVPPAALPCSLLRCTQGEIIVHRGCEAAKMKYKQFIKCEQHTRQSGNMMVLLSQTALSGPSINHRMRGRTYTLPLHLAAPSVPPRPSLPLDSPTSCWLPAFRRWGCRLWDRGWWWRAWGGGVGSGAAAAAASADSAGSPSNMASTGGIPASAMSASISSTPR